MNGLGERERRKGAEARKVQDWHIGKDGVVVVFNGTLGWSSICSGSIP